jgi:hypothetical protein
LAEFPLVCVGADFSVVSRDATKDTLTKASIPHIVVFGDIQDPMGLIGALRLAGVLNVNRVLHIRSFLDHDRPYTPPTHGSSSLLACSEDGAYMTRSGE